MRYILSNKFQKQLKKTPEKIIDKIGEKLNVFINNFMDPTLNNHSLKGEWTGYKSINITPNLRAIYKEVDKNLVRFVALGTHSELYE